MRIFFDTNALVAAFATRGICSDLMRLVLAEHDLVTSDVVLKELDRALAARIGLTRERRRALLAFLAAYLGEESLTVSAPNVVRDADDEAVVRCALARGAEILVTGDNDLLEASLPLPTVSPRGCWERLRRRRPRRPATAGNDA